MTAALLRNSMTLRIRGGIGRRRGRPRGRLIRHPTRASRSRATAARQPRVIRKPVPAPPMRGRPGITARDAKPIEGERTTDRDKSPAAGVNRRRLAAQPRWQALWRKVAALPFMLRRS
jgi:hypothetical protein